MEVVRPSHAFPWSEDFGHFTAGGRGLLLGLGAGMETPPLHSPLYDFPDELIGPGVRLLEALTREALRGAGVEP